MSETTSDGSGRSILPKWVARWIWLNPMAPPIMAAQDILLYGKWPNWGNLGIVLAIAALLCAWGWRLFRRHSGELVDEL